MIPAKQIYHVAHFCNPIKKETRKKKREPPARRESPTACANSSGGTTAGCGQHLAGKISSDMQVGGVTGLRLADLMMVYLRLDVGFYRRLRVDGNSRIVWSTRLLEKLTCFLFMISLLCFFPPKWFLRVLDARQYVSFIFPVPLPQIYTVSIIESGKGERTWIGLRGHLNREFSLRELSGSSGRHWHESAWSDRLGTSRMAYDDSNNEKREGGLSPVSKH